MDPDLIELARGQGHIRHPDLPSEELSRGKLDSD
jgi:hypothetical protein